MEKRKGWAGSGQCSSTVRPQQLGSEPGEDP